MPRVLLEFPSNSGYYLLRIAKTMIEPNAGDITGRLVLLARSGDLACDWVIDSRLVIPRIAISVPALRKLRTDLRSWLDGPNLVDASLAEGTQEFSLSVGPTPEVISSMDKPVLSCEYSDFHTACVLRFVVDQSCVRICAESLDWLGPEE